jgi:hypothetical protein
MRFFTGVLVSILILQTHAQACTAFLLKNDTSIWVGKSYDWWRGYGHGALYTNHRGLQKTALVIDKENLPARWVSRYGSITFTQFGREFPVGGMNEKGLVVENLQLQEAKYSTQNDERMTVNEGQWTQYQLDNYATTAEVVAHVNDLRVAGIFTGLHYFVCDNQGACAVVEFLKGKAVVHSGHDLKIPVLTNNNYEESLAYFERNKQKAQLRSMFGNTSLVRFWKAAKYSQERPYMSPFTLLEEVRMDGLEPSYWNLVYDPVNLVIYFRTRYNLAVKSIDMKLLNFSCKSQALMLDITSIHGGSVLTGLQDYTPAENQKLIEQNRFLLSNDKRRLAALYPESTSCTEEKNP